MQRGRLLIIAVVLAVFIVVGGFLALRGTGGGGKAVAIDLKVTGTTMTPDSPRAALNDTVTMTITADRKEEIHLHGYDLAFAVPGPGQSAIRTFKADKSGGFAMEIEDTGQPLGIFTVTAAQ